MVIWMMAMMAVADDGCETGRVTLDGAVQADLATALAAAAEGSTIEVCDGTYVGNFVATVPVHLVAPDGPDLTVLDGGLAGTVLTVPGGSSLTGFTVTNGATDGNGGGLNLSSAGSLDLEDCTVTGNSAVVHGGGLFAPDGAVVAARNSRFTNNAAGGGGGLYVGQLGTDRLGSVLDLTGTVVVGNLAHGNTAREFGGQGGGVVGNHVTLIGGDVSGNESVSAPNPAWPGSLFVGGGGGVRIGGTSTLVGTVVYGNTTEGFGGGMYINFGSNVTLDGVTIEANAAIARGYDGGGVYVSSGTVDARGSVIRGNDGVFGGGVHLAHDSHWIGGEIVGNHAQDGGGIWVFGGHHVIEDVVIRDNESRWYGGGIAGSWYHPAYTRNSLEIRGCEISDNVSLNANGGGIDLGQPATIADCELKGNVARWGGAISVAGWRGYTTALMPYTLENVEMSGNEATVSGGGLYITDGAEVFSTAMEVKDNLAPVAGGVEIEDGALTAVDTELKGGNPDDLYITDLAASYVGLDGTYDCTVDGCPTE